MMRAAGDDPERAEVTWFDRRALASRVADQRSARSYRERIWTANAARPVQTRQGRQASGGRDGPVGAAADRPLAGCSTDAAGQNAW